MVRSQTSSHQTIRRYNTRIEQKKNHGIVLHPIRDQDRSRTLAAGRAWLWFYHNPGTHNRPLLPCYRNMCVYFGGFFSVISSFSLFVNLIFWKNLLSGPVRGRRGPNTDICIPRS